MFVVEFSNLAGVYFHTFKDGKIEFQGRIIRVVGNLAVCQLYNFLNGSESNVKILPLVGMQLYRTSEDMRDFYG